MDLEELRAFLAVVETGSFFSASTATGMSRTTLRRRVDALEARAGVKLVERTRRGIVITAPGELIAQRGRQMLQETRALLENVREHGTEPAGVLRIVVPSGTPGFFTSPWIQWMRRKFQRLRVVIQMVDDPVANLLNGADIALHFGPAPVGPWLSSLLFGGDERLFASRPYLKRKGTPESVSALTEHDLICTTAAGESPNAWPLLSGGEFPIEPAVVSTSLGLCGDLTAQGQGICLLPVMYTKSRSRHKLVPLLEDEVGFERHIRITVPEVLASIPKINMVFEGSVRFYNRAMEMTRQAPPSESGAFADDRADSSDVA